MCLLQSISETWWKHLVAGSMGGIVSRSCTAPLDRLKVLAQVNVLRIYNKNILKNCYIKS